MIRTPLTQARAKDIVVAVLKQCISYVAVYLLCLSVLKCDPSRPVYLRLSSCHNQHRLIPFTVAGIRARYLKSIRKLNRTLIWSDVWRVYPPLATASRLYKHSLSRLFYHRPPPLSLPHRPHASCYRSSHGRPRQGCLFPLNGPVGRLLDCALVKRRRMALEETGSHRRTCPTLRPQYDVLL